MTSSRRRRGQDVGPDLYSPAEVAKRLRCSEWWVKEQARRRRIPFAWIGGSYRFTEDHLQEIIRAFEVRPVTCGAPPEAVAARPTSRARPPAARPTVQLRSKTPRRAKGSGSAA